MVASDIAAAMRFSAQQRYSVHWSQLRTNVFAASLPRLQWCRYRGTGQTQSPPAASSQEPVLQSTSPVSGWDGRYFRASTRTGPLYQSKCSTGESAGSYPPLPASQSFRLSHTVPVGRKNLTLQFYRFNVKEIPIRLCAEPNIFRVIFPVHLCPTPFFAFPGNSISHMKPRFQNR